MRGMNFKGEDRNMKPYHDVKGIQFIKDQLVLKIDGKERAYNLKVISTALLGASDIERITFEISPSGYGIHWPLIDEDLSVDGLLGVVHSPDFVLS